MPLSINLCIILGRLGTDPEIKTIGTDRQVVNVSVATSKSWKDKSGEWQERTEWHRVVAWDFAATALAKFKKGDSVYIQGMKETRVWENTAGIKQYTVELTADIVAPGTGAWPKIEETQSAPENHVAPEPENDELPF